MDKNTIIGFALIALVLVGFSYWTRPSEAELAAQRKQDSIAAVMRQKAEKAAQTARMAKQAAAMQKVETDTTALFHQALNGKAENVMLTNDKVELVISTKGATVTGTQR